MADFSKYYFMYNNYLNFPFNDKLHTAHRSRRNAPLAPVAATADSITITKAA